MKTIKNGDVFDIGQTVNGVSKFLWFNEKWYYFEERLTREYEYDQMGLSKMIREFSEWDDDIKFVVNILAVADMYK